MTLKSVTESSGLNFNSFSGKRLKQTLTQMKRGMQPGDVICDVE